MGSREFKAEMRPEMAERGAELERFAGVEPERVQSERAELWEERLRALAKVAKIDLAKLSTQKSHPDKVRLAAALKQSTSVPNAWLAERLGLGPPASASQFMRRLSLRETGRAETAGLLSRVRDLTSSAPSDILGYPVME